MGKSKKRKLSKQKLSLDDDDDLDGDAGVVREYSPLHVYEDYVIHVEDGAGAMPPNFLRQIAIEHSKLVKTTSKSAKYWLLQSIFKLNACILLVSENVCFWFKYIQPSLCRL